MARCPLSAVVLLLLTAGALPAADLSRMPLPGESAATGRRLDAADKLAADKDYAAAEEYARLLEQAGDDLVAVSEHVSLPVRRLCHLRLAALPPEALRPYRTRVDAQARKWLEQGAADRDVWPLQRIVDEAFCSRATDAALDLLGDLAFERGRFHEAVRWWRMIALPASEAAVRVRHPPPPPWSRAGLPPHLDLLYPDPQVDVARVRAEQILAALFLGEAQAARAELAAFRALHPRAEGHLAGRRGNYADILQAVAARPILPEPAEDAWPTFAAALARGPVLPAERSDPNRLNRLVAEGPAWRYRFDTHSLVKGEWTVPPTAISAAERARRLAFLPVVVGRDVLTADARSVSALDTANGTCQTWDVYDDDARAGATTGPRPSTRLPAAPDLRYTLTALEGRVYARLGVQGLAPPKTGEEADSFLACLEFSEPGHKLKAVWVRGAEPAGAGPRPIFEGAPVVRDGLLHVAATRFENGTQVTEVRCYSADSDALPRWKQDVVATRLGTSLPRQRHHLLTLADRYVVFASHTGAVIALDARTGHRAWTYRHPSAVMTTQGGNPLPRDLAPAVYAYGRLYVAPADYDRVLCLDVETGRLLWEREHVAVVHLLGAGNGRLIFTTTKGVRALRAADGTDDWIAQPAEPEGLPSFGRGFLAGDYVYWPTAAGVQVLGQADGQPPIDLIDGPVRFHLKPGHMAYAGRILAVTDEIGLRVYLPPEHRTSGAEPPPPAVPAHTLEGLARGAGELAAAGRPVEAVATWQQILADETLGRGALRDPGGLPQSATVVAAERIDELIRRHGREVYAPADDQARLWLACAEDDAAALERLAREYPNANASAQALRQLARVYEDSGRWGAAAHTYRRLLRRAPGDAERGAALAGLSRAVDRDEKPAGPAEPPGLATPLCRSWDKDERLLSTSGPVPASHVFLARGTAVVCRDVTRGAERWARPFLGAPTSAGCDAGIAVVAGPDAVQAFAISDGTPLWDFPAPDAAAFGDPRLSSLRIAGGRVFCLQGECRLLTLDASSGRVVWQNWAPAARWIADVAGCRFSPHYLATADRILLQSQGRCRMLDARTGAVVRELATEKILWPQPPLRLGETLVAVVNAGRSVTALDLADGTVAWVYELPRRPSLTGEPPVLLGTRGALLVAVPRNDGYWLQRLDPASGRALWDDEVLLGPDRIDPGSVAVDRESVYYSSRNLVTARALDGGGRAWTADAELPGPVGRWQLRRLGSALLVWPGEARRVKFHSHWLTASLEYAVTFSPEGGPGRGIPLLVLDPRSGAACQQLNFVPPVPKAQGRSAAGEELRVLPRILIERATADGPAVQLVSKGLVVGWDSKAWALHE
jgi:outer membrane protein assembly factor BamB